MFVIPELHSSAALFEECPSNTPKLAIDLIPPSLGFECEMRAQYLSSPFWPRRLATAYDQSGPLSLSVIILDRGIRNNLPGLLSPDPPTCGSVRAVGPSHPQTDQEGPAYNKSASTYSSTAHTDKTFSHTADKTLL